MCSFAIVQEGSVVYTFGRKHTAACMAYNGMNRYY